MLLTKSFYSLHGRRSFAAAVAKQSEGTSLSTSKRIQKFSLFSKPKETVPLMEITRKLGGNIAETIYQIGFEKQYSRDSLLRGANEGASLISACIVDRNWDKLSSVAVTDLQERLQKERERLHDSEIQTLRFTPDDIVHSFLYSSVIAGKKIFKLSSSGNLGIYFTVVSFTRLDPSVPERITLSEAIGKYKNDLLTINVTFARTLNPLGIWKATAFNAFTQDY